MLIIVIGDENMTKNKLYRKFLDGEFLEQIKPNEIRMALENVKGRHQKEGRALLIILYQTGARPSEVLELKGEDVYKEKNIIYLKIKTLKRGRARILDIPLKKQFIQEFWDFARGIYPKLYIFRNFRSYYERKIYKDGKLIKVKKEISNNLRYYFAKWFKDKPIPPYYLRHNRFSIAAERGADTKQIMYLKGATSEKSVFPYVHIMTSNARKLRKVYD